MSDPIPETMRAVLYQGPENFSVTRVPVPKVGDDDVLMKVEYCGICGTDAHIHRGGFNPTFPLIPGHEPVGTIVARGARVTSLALGQRIVADCSIVCGECAFCREGRPLHCAAFGAVGIQAWGGFAEYLAFPAARVFPLVHLPPADATLLESAACAVHGLDRLRAVGALTPGGRALVLGAGPTGLVLAQLLAHTGAATVALAAPPGPKLAAAARVLPRAALFAVDRADPAGAWARVQAAHPAGFDLVVEATGGAELAQKSIDFVRRGGTLLLYGVYDEAARVTWSPARIFREEITVVSSFSQTLCFPRALAYLDGGPVRLDGFVTHEFPLEDYQKALDLMASREAVKIVIKM